MKRILLILAIAFIPSGIFSANLTIHLKSGAKVSVSVDDIKKITFGDTVSEVNSEALAVSMFANALISPNPSSDNINISFCLSAFTLLKVQITDFSQNILTELASGNFEPGAYTLNWDGKNARGNDCSSGIYFCRFICGKTSMVKKIILAR